MKAVHEDLIRRRAYEIWEARGRPHGLEREHWEEAERELLNAAPPIAERPPAGLGKKRGAAPPAEVTARPAPEAVAKSEKQPRRRGETPRAG